MMLLGNVLQPETAKRIKIIIEIVDIKNGLIRTVRRQKRVIICKNLQRFPKDPIVRGRYHKLKKQYKRLVKDKEHAFRKKMLDSISQSEKNNPKLFWDMVNRLRSCKKKIWQITLIRRNGINGLGI